MDAVVTVHDIPYDSESNWMTFQVGTCHGWFGESGCECEVYGISNSTPGNGHFAMAIEWLERRCRDKGLDLLMTHFTNDRLRIHMITKLGFSKISDKCVIKRIVVKNNEP